MKTLFTLTLLLLLLGCKTVYVPVEKVRTEYSDRLRIDSVIERDSIYLKMNGDTVWMEKYITRFRDRIVHDSIHTTDSIPVPYEVPVYVEKKLSWWQTLRIRLGDILVFGLLGYFLLRTIKRKLKS